MLVLVSAIAEAVSVSLVPVVVGVESLEEPKTCEASSLTAARISLLRNDAMMD